MNGLRTNGGDDIAATPPIRIRRHRECGVFGEHRGDGIHVAALPGVDVPVDNLAHALVAQRAQGGLLALLGRAPPVAERYGALDYLLIGK